MKHASGPSRAAFLYTMETVVVSSFFSEGDGAQSDLKEISDYHLESVDELNNCLAHLELPRAVECIYNPTLYARQTFEMYIRRYCNTTKDIMYLGMNPGPWGMSQTGVPFGEISSVRDWLGIEGPVEKPHSEITKRPVLGFECTRIEVSGKRFWGLFKDICGTPDNFFRTSFVYNYLPQQWMKNNGCNITPGDFRVSEMENLYNICDPFLIKALDLYEVKIIVAIGSFCENRARKAIKKYCPAKAQSIQILHIPHPSPRAMNNSDWDKKAMECLKNLNLLQYYTTEV